MFQSQHSKLEQLDLDDPYQLSIYFSLYIGCCGRRSIENRPEGLKWIKTWDLFSYKNFKKLTKEFVPSEFKRAETEEISDETPVLYYETDVDHPEAEIKLPSEFEGKCIILQKGAIWINEGPRFHFNPNFQFPDLTKRIINQTQIDILTEEQIQYNERLKDYDYDNPKQLAIYLNKYLAYWISRPKEERPKNLQSLVRYQIQDGAFFEALIKDVKPPPKFLLGKTLIVVKRQKRPMIIIFQMIYLLYFMNQMNLPQSRSLYPQSNKTIQIMIPF